MIIPKTLTFDSVDVDLLDRMAAVQGGNRSAVLREILAEFRPMFRQLVETLEAAQRQKDQFLESVGASALAEMLALEPEVEKIQNAALGAMARAESALVALEAADLVAEVDPE